MNVVFCSSEISPFAKTGGLGDVGLALPKSLAKAGCVVKVFMPLYKNIVPEENYKYFGVNRRGNLEIFFIKNSSYFKRKFIYGTKTKDYPDNLERFSFFSRRVLEILKQINFIPDIIHNNDWHSSLVSVYFKILYKSDKFFQNTKLLLTIHNLAYQGLFSKDKFFCLGIPNKYFSLRYLKFYDQINVLKGGIVFSDMVNTVSLSYAKQIKSSEHGCGLNKVLKSKSTGIRGILNAVDYDIWNPKTDKLIYRKYSIDTLKNKTFNKVRLQKELGLKINKNSFLLVMVSRLAEQKGLDLLNEVLDFILQKHQVVILGTGNVKYHRSLAKIQEKFKNSFSVQLKFDEKLAHKIYAAGDCFLMPSRFEPCGLSQLISYKYATVPIVYHTGGLIDTVKDISQGGGGVVFKKYTHTCFLSAVKRAERVFNRKDKWNSILKKISRYDFSWDKTAQEYINVYKKLGKKK